MNEKYQEKLGRLLANTYGIKGHDHQRIGKLVETSYLLLEQEEMRDLREQANQAQYDEDWQSNARDRAIAQNGNVGYD